MSLPLEGAFSERKSTAFCTRKLLKMMFFGASFAVENVVALWKTLWIIRKTCIFGLKFAYFRRSMQECKKMERIFLWKTPLASWLCEIFSKAIDFRREIGYNGIAKRVTRRL